MSHRLACAARDLLHALDAGILGDGHKFHDGDESAFVSALRNALDAFNAKAAARGERRVPPIKSAPHHSIPSHG